MRGKMLATLSLLLLVATINGIAYSRWQETARIRGTVTMGHWKLVIESQKLLVPIGIDFNETHLIYYFMTPDERSLKATCENVDHEWTIAIGLIVKNTGTLPLTLKGTRIELSGPEADFNIESYTYGPFPPGAGLKPYWDGIRLEEVPREGYRDRSILLDQGDRAITWTTIEYIGTEITDIELTATPIDDPYP